MSCVLGVFFFFFFIEWPGSGRTDSFIHGELHSISHTYRPTAPSELLSLSLESHQCRHLQKHVPILLEQLLGKLGSPYTTDSQTWGLNFNNTCSFNPYICHGATHHQTGTHTRLHDFHY